ncbi:HNH endonuclease [Methylobacterium sp. J-030]|uniref:HNH endonuclease n=1 Tax=Methylobacterium sp. J-030 TaxID=2836627 RepID=UPI001FB9399C|nr:HNH endonuclease signature motif containing protein [Methylobacterium sp. J-030]MCJ2067818.1 HNH endonuclease [Methylobacterium sp. J-030]
MVARQRQNFSKAVRIQALERAAGRCEGDLPSGDRCTCAIPIGGRIFDHVIPDANGGRPTLDNCQVLCLPCDRAKYSADRRAIDKARRQAERHAGTKAPSRPMPGSSFCRTSRGFGITRDRATGAVLSRRGSIDVRDL